jgi:tRNA (guanine-N7-)-methyltransferase
MSKGKLEKFAEMKNFSNVLQPDIKNYIGKNFELKGKWHQFFGNNNPIILELGCGKGEYSVGLAQKYPNKNFIGIDIKGARIYTGAKLALELNLKNILFIRSKIEFLDIFFDSDEISEIWLPFPDPQRKKQKKRLLNARFLNLYKSFLVHNGTIHLKTDNPNLYTYTLKILNYNNIQPIIATDDLYNSDLNNDATAIQTFYEKMFLSQGKKIFYIEFKLNKNITYKEIPEKFTWKKTSKYA